MSSPPGLGKNLYNETLVRGKTSSKVVRECLRKMIETHPGPQEMAMLIAKAALNLGVVDESFHELDQIGQQVKSWSKPEG